MQVYDHSNSCCECDENTMTCFCNPDDKYCDNCYNWESTLLFDFTPYFNRKIFCQKCLTDCFMSMDLIKKDYVEKIANEIDLMEFL